MKVYIDISVLNLATFVTGIQRVTREIVIRLIEKEKDNISLLHYNAKENKYHVVDIGLFYEFYKYNHGIKNKMITKQKLELSEIRLGAIFFDLDAAWMCRLKRSYLLPILKKQGVKIIAHVYDIISITHPQYCLQRGVYNFMDFIGAHLQYADAIIVNAQATITELERLSECLAISLPKCYVVPLGADFKTFATANDNDMPQRLVQVIHARPYILMVGTIEPRKNHKLLLEAFDKGLKDLGYNIIMAGYTGWNMENFTETLMSHPDYNKRIFHFTGLNDLAVNFLYKHAKFLAFCSYTEGFGLPLIEAIMRGTPVIASDISVSREVGGEYCVWFEQDNAESLIAKVVELEKNKEKYSALKTFLHEFKATSWEECGNNVRKILAEINNQKN